MWAPDTLALIGVTFVIAGLVKGVVGIGLPTVSLAILTVFIGLRDAMALMILPSMATNVWQALAGPALGEVVRRFWPMAVASVIGIFAGLGVGVGVPAVLLSALLGASLVVYAANGLWGVSFYVAPRRETVLTPVMGFVAGIMSGLVGVFIVPGVLYIQLLRVPKEVFVQAMGMLLLVVSLSLGLALSRHNLYSADHALVSGLCVLPAFFGLYIGGRIRARLSEAHFSTAIYIALAAFGSYLILGAFVNLP